MSTAFPHQYQLTVTRTGRARADLEAAGRPVIAGSPPPEFDGPADRWSPEHLLLAAIGLCFETTFDYLAGRAHLGFSGWVAHVRGTLDRTSAGLAFTRFVVELQLEVEPADLERTRAILERARTTCLVSEALRIPVELEAHIVSSPAASLESVA